MSNVIVGAITVVGLTTTLIALMFGTSIVEKSYPDFRNIDFGACDEGSGFGAGLAMIGCWVANVGAIILNIVFFLGGTVVFLFNVMTFNIPGAPGWVRALISLLLGGPVLFVIAIAIFRGSGDGG